MSMKAVDHNDKNRPKGKTSILAYGYNKKEKEILEKYSLELGIKKVIMINNEETDFTIKELISRENHQTLEINNTKEKFIVLNAVSDFELNNFIGNFKSNNLKRPLFAVVTETSLNWSFKRLVEDLLKERAAFMAKKKS